MRLSSFESFWYVLINIFTLGVPFLWKVVIKKALIETEKGGDFR